MLPLKSYIEHWSASMCVCLLLCWCFTALRHFSGHFRCGQLTYPHWSWASLLGSLPVLSAHSFSSNLQLPFLNQRKGENGIRVIPPWSSGSSLKWAIKFLLKHTTFHKKFKISLKWMKNFLMSSIHFFKNLPEMEEKPPWYPFETYHMYGILAEIISWPSSTK